MPLKRFTVRCAFSSPWRVCRGDAPPHPCIKHAAKWRCKLKQQSSKHEHLHREWQGGGSARSLTPHDSSSRQQMAEFGPSLFWTLACRSSLDSSSVACLAPRLIYHGTITSCTNPPRTLFPFCLYAHANAHAHDLRLLSFAYITHGVHRVGRVSIMFLSVCAHGHIAACLLNSREWHPYRR